MPSPCDFLKGCGNDGQPFSPGMPSGAGLPNNPNSFATRNYNLFTNFKTTVFTFAATGTDVASTFPTIRRMESFGWASDIGIIAMRLTSSVVNVTTGVNGTAGIFLGRDQGTENGLVGMGNGFDLFLDHITLQNSVAGSSNPSNNRTQISFGDSTVIPIRSGQRIALYACGGNSADNLFSAMAIVYWIQIKI